MTTTAKLPKSGYFIERVYANRLGLTAVPETPAAGPDFLFGWDWKLIDQNLFEVNITLLLEPTPDRSERVEVSMIGVFRQGSDPIEVKLEEFVRYHAPAILMPYVREAVSSLTGRGYYPARNLNPINVQMLMERQDPNRTTGAKQLASSRGTPMIGPPT